MNERKIFTYVSPKTNQEVASSLCATLPIVLKSVNSVEELFPLLSDHNYHTDFIAIDIAMFQGRKDNLDMFDIIHTLSTLIKSTVYRLDQQSKPKRRNTKIFVIVDENTNPILVKQVMNFPDIATVSWLLKDPADYQSVEEHAKRIIDGDFTPHPKVLELIKPKKKIVKKPNTITLTVRQAQILQLVQDRGCSNKHIARMLGLSESTVKLHMSAIFKKYGVKNRTQLAVFSKGSVI